MLHLGNNLVPKPVLSLRNGQPVAVANGLLFNPDNLRIEGLYCQAPGMASDLILLAQDIREFSSKGYIINDFEVLSEIQDLIRLKPIIDQQFMLANKPVETLAGQKLGKVSDFAVDPQNMMIMKLYVSKPIYKSLTGGSLVVDRNQIQNVTDKKIIINNLDATEAITAPAAAA